MVQRMRDARPGTDSGTSAAQDSGVNDNDTLAPPPAAGASASMARHAFPAPAVGQGSAGMTIEQSGEKAMSAFQTVERPAGILYNSTTGLMVMEFGDRGRHIYRDVPSGVYDVLKEAGAGVHARFVNETGRDYSVIEGIDGY